LQFIFSLRSKHAKATHKLKEIVYSLLRKPTYFLIFTLVFLMLSCNTKKREYVSKPTRSAANSESEFPEVNTMAVHLDDTTSRVFFEIANENLLYKRPDTSKAFYAEVQVRYRLLHGPSSKKAIEEGTVVLFDRSERELISEKFIFGSFDIKAHTSQTYFIEFDFLDVHKKARYAKTLNIFKESRFTAQNFLVSKNNAVVFKNSFVKNEIAEIEYFNRGINELLVECFYREYGPALPPFSAKTSDVMRYKPDSTFKIYLNNQKFQLSMPRKGFYHVKGNLNSFEGLTLYTVDETFPGVSNSLEMINCTRYIMSKVEYEKCINAEDKKEAIDAFWLNIGGSNERAVELLKRYYGRVKEANKNYSSYTHGWKSDRGMIYIVFGKPGNVFHSKSSEVWIYGNEANPNALRFVFNKTQNPFSENDYVLERSPFYKEPYHTAVEYWRQGLIFNDGLK